MTAGEQTERRVIEMPYAVFAADGFRVEMVTRAGIERPVYHFAYRGDTIWGATARILIHYLGLVAGSAPPRT